MRAFFGLVVAAQLALPPPPQLPDSAVAQLAASLAAAAPHVAHVWRDTPPVNGDGTINGYIEIPRSERRKFEFNMETAARRIDRVLPVALGGYPVNYGFVPQTVSYDGDPFDILVLGPPARGGRVVRGVAVAVMHMEDEKGLDSKVVVSPVDRSGRALYQLTAADRTRIGDFFRKYKDGEPGKFSRVPGWGSREDGLAYVRMTHEFFLRCRQRTGVCTV